MRNEQKKKRLKKILIVLGIILGVLAVLFGGFELIKQSKITNIEVKTNNLTCTDQDQISKFISSKNLNYFDFKKDKLAEDLKIKFFCLGREDITLSYPNKLTLEVWNRDAAFIVKEIRTASVINPVVNLPDVFTTATESTKAVETVRVIDDVLKEVKTATETARFLSDKEGMVFSNVETPVVLPEVSFLGYKLEIGKNIPDGIISKVTEVIEKLNAQSIPSDNLIIIGEKLIVDSKPRIIFSLTKRLDYQTASLQLILTQSKINSDPGNSGSNNIESIDLRFDKPVVVYSKK